MSRYFFITLWRLIFDFWSNAWMFPILLINPLWIPDPGNAVCISGGWKALSFLRQRKCAEQAIVGWQSFSSSDTNTLNSTNENRLYWVIFRQTILYTGSTIISCFFHFSLNPNRSFLRLGAVNSSNSSWCRESFQEQLRRKGINQENCKVGSTKGSEGKVWTCLSCKRSQDWIIVCNL